MDDGANFCKKCGARVQEQPSAQYAGSGVHSQSAQYPGNNASQPPSSAPSGKKKKSKGKVIGIIALVFIVLAVIGNMEEKRLREQDKDPADATQGAGNAEDLPTGKGDAEFDKGRIADGWYVNEWAELCFDTSGWSNGTQEDYDSYSAENAVVGAVLLNNTTGAQVIAGFEELSGVNRLITEEAYLNITTTSIKEQFQDSGLVFTASAYSDTYVAGNPYKKATFTFENGAVESLYVRNYDGHMIYIIVVAPTAAEDETIISRFYRSVTDAPSDDPGVPDPTQGGFVYTDGRVPHYTGDAPQWEKIRYEWPRQDKTGTLWMELYLDAEMYRHYLGLERYQGVENYHFYTDDPNNKAIVAEIVRVFRQVSGDIQYSEDDTVREVANFVQNVITYETDADTTGQEEYPRYPIETLYERRGDCEDTSILMAALLRELGYEVGFFHLPNHVAVALRTTDDYSAGAYYEINGHRYLYIESTATGWNIGDIPDDLLEVEATFYPLQ